MANKNKISLENKLHNHKNYKNGFAIPQVLILGVGIAVAVSGLISVSLLGLTGSKIKRQELIAKASSFSGITTIRSLLNDSSRDYFHYFWLVDSFNEQIPNPSQEYWSDNDWCKGSAAPPCSSTRTHLRR